MLMTGESCATGSEASETLPKITFKKSRTFFANKRLLNPLFIRLSKMINLFKNLLRNCTSKARLDILYVRLIIACSASVKCVCSVHNINNKKN
jgi:hypothetical protein